MIPLSVLDLAPIVEGGDARRALQDARALAGHVERLGYHRDWLAEHHGMPGVASAATAVVIAHVAEATRTIRVGAGGVMLPNHAPLVVAEQFGTLAALYPGRVDLGLGRAPGSDPATARALRRPPSAGDQFPHDVVELMEWFAPPRPGQAIVAVPGAGLDVPIWILGSSTFGAQLAAALGLPFAFASHFAPAMVEQALDLYRAGFRPSERLERPYAMLGVNAIVADTDAEAERLLTSLQQAFLALRRGTPGPLPPPVEGFAATLQPFERAMLDQVLSFAAVGAPERARARLAEIVARTGADELMVAAQVHDAPARRRSYALLAEAWGLGPPD
jgi:luciferase family oxidoreductase group 1